MKIVTITTLCNTIFRFMRIIIIGITKNRYLNIRDETNNTDNFNLLSSNEINIIFIKSISRLTVLRSETFYVCND